MLSRSLLFVCLSCTTVTGMMHELGAMIRQAQQRSLQYKDVRVIDNRILDTEEIVRIISSQPGLVTTDCIKDIMLIADSLGNTSSAIFSDLALPMFDSSGKVPPGILRGRLTFNGHYAECKSINYDIPGSSRKFEAEFFKFWLSTRALLGVNATHASDFYDASDVQITVDVCLPLSCTSTELRRFFVGDEPRDVCALAKVNDYVEPIEWQFIAIVTAAGVIVFLCFSAGLVDFYFAELVKQSRWKSSLLWRSYMCFSFYTNVASIFDVSTANKAGQINAIHCIRFFSITWVVISHLTLYMLWFSNYRLDIVELNRDTTSQFILNGYFSVDSFFFMSGLLLAFLWAKTLKKDRRTLTSPMSWVMFYVHRILRLSPPFYAAVFGFGWVYYSIMRDQPMETGPTAPARACRERWWADVLYLTNYLTTTTEYCIGVSWYLSAEMQMFIFTPLVLVPLALRPAIGYAVGVGLLLLSTIANIVTVYVKRYPPNLTFFGTLYDGTDMKDYDILVYYSTYIRCQIYIMGLLVGWFMQTRQRLVINPLLNLVLWIVALSLMLTVVLGLADYSNGLHIDLFWSAMYSSLSRIVWGAGLAWIVVSCYYGSGGPINAFLSWHVWIPLGRLSYCVFLTHYFFIAYLLGLSSDGVGWNGFSEMIITRGISFLCLSFFLAVFWSAFFEMPFGKLEMLFLGGAQRRGDGVVVRPKKRNEGEEVDVAWQTRDDAKAAVA